MLIRNEKGLTLIEALVTITITSLLLIYVFDFISTSTEIVGDEYKKNEEQTKINTFSTVILEDLKYAKEIELEDVGNGNKILFFSNNSGTEFEFLFDSNKDEVLMKSGLNNEYIKLFKVTDNPSNEMIKIEEGYIIFDFLIENIRLYINYSIKPAVGVVQ
jgi:hypothetical protein